MMSVILSETDSFWKNNNNEQKKYQLSHHRLQYYNSPDRLPLVTNSTAGHQHNYYNSRRTAPEDSVIHLFIESAIQLLISCLGFLLFAGFALLKKMKRPSDQAKLLFFALLRGTVSALAVESKAGMMAAASSATTSAVMGPPTMSMSATSASKAAAAAANSAHIQLRLARKNDIPFIQQCNLATLPENYNNNFYNYHIRSWPDLALVAEYVPSQEEQLEQQRKQRKQQKEMLKQQRPTSSAAAFFSSSPFGALNNNNNNMMGTSSSSNSEECKKVVAYVLGKVQPTSGDPFNGEPNETGHVISLAVLQPYRRNGLAAALMNQLHFHLHQCYGASAVGLHVRKSNEAAYNLYSRYGYRVATVIPGYYQDGEDAYFMKKQLDEAAAGGGAIPPERIANGGASVSDSFSFLARRPRPWETAPMGLRLPRIIELVDEQKLDTDDNDDSTTVTTASSSTTPSAIDEEETPELLTGTM